MQRRISRLWPLLAVWALVWLDAGAANGIESLVFKSRQDWLENWTFPKGTLEIDPGGRIRPRFIQKNNNASLNAGQFIAEKDAQGNVLRWGGILGVGSNEAEAGRILDGDPDTGWGPNPADDPKKWWIEVDLGRVVTATRIVLKFAPGRPFEQFAIYASDGDEAFFSGSRVKDYQLVKQTTQPNSEEVLQYELKTDLADGEEVPRQLVRFVFVEVTAPSADLGQLAELEVFGLGDNVVLGSVERLGSVVMGLNDDEISGQKVADGDFLTRENLLTVIFDWRKRGWLRMDLGSLFWLDTIRILGFSGAGTSALVGYKLFVSDGTTVPGTVNDRVLLDLVWQEVGSLERNPPPGETAARFLFEDAFTLRPVRYILFSNRNNETNRGPAAREEISEIQAFGEGFVAGPTLTSKLITLGTSSNLVAVGWKAVTPPGTSVEIRTRTGDQIEEIPHYFCNNGLECGKRKQDQEVGLFGGSGPIIIEQRPDTTWSGWSRPYLFSGEGFASPSPRKFLLIQARLLGQGPHLAPSLEQIELFYADPVARQLHGEVQPGTAAPARPAEFSYLIRPEFGATNPGFDQILLRSPSPAQLLRVRVGDIWYEAAEMDSIYAARDTLWMALPVRVRAQTEPEVEVQFQTTIFDDNTLFEVLVANSRDPGSYQRVDPLVEDATTVRLPLPPSLIEAETIQAEIFTPNGDGINDEMVVEFTVLKLSQPRPVRVGIYTLLGEMVRALEVRELNGRSGLSGRYRGRWDGRDAAGQMAAPGIYLCRIEVEAQDEAAVLMRSVALVF